MNIIRAGDPVFYVELKSPSGGIPQVVATTGTDLDNAIQTVIAPAGWLKGSGFYAGTAFADRLDDKAPLSIIPHPAGVPIAIQPPRR